ncbi:YALI0A19866p [Yarrowia lipolytica CLIB122]|uniref:YALI0A19866p n=2 Tax=Yarrowia lipolytica TaxID=4952 RepID=Q6CGF1_YARLI|nr:YALI0A19866p [Yarrowia lipolytica CLIB122]CAG84199.1 YALI0A19866p [Yarrowia lipolytica CLIB122]|eukprot:XP_500261.1 YALI0A19866p [Yarrowia lipolytica CLIB122]
MSTIVSVHEEHLYIKAFHPTSLKSFIFLCNTTIMKFLTIITMATAALATVGDKYKLTYKKVGSERVDETLYPISDSGVTLFASGYGEPITITEHENNTFSVEGRLIAHDSFMDYFTTSTTGGTQIGSSFDISADGTFELHDGPKEYYYCVPGPAQATIFATKDPNISRCITKQVITFHVDKI